MHAIGRDWREVKSEMEFDLVRRMKKTLDPKHILNSDGCCDRLMPASLAAPPGLALPRK
jgi:FAD/FMN-containing dehydrogenase